MTGCHSNTVFHIVIIAIYSLCCYSIEYLHFWSSTFYGTKMKCTIRVHYIFFHVNKTMVFTNQVYTDYCFFHVPSHIQATLFLELFCFVVNLCQLEVNETSAQIFVQNKRKCTIQNQKQYPSMQIENFPNTSSFVFLQYSFHTVAHTIRFNNFIFHYYRSLLLTNCIICFLSY